MKLWSWKVQKYLSPLSYIQRSRFYLPIIQHNLNHIRIASQKIVYTTVFKKALFKTHLTSNIGSLLTSSILLLGTSLLFGSCLALPFLTFFSFLPFSFFLAAALLAIKIWRDIRKQLEWLKCYISQINGDFCIMCVAYHIAVCQAEWCECVHLAGKLTMCMLCLFLGKGCEQ